MNIGGQVGSAILEFFLAAFLALSVQTERVPESQLQSEQVQESQVQEEQIKENQTQTGQAQESQDLNGQERASHVIVHEEEVVIPGLEKEFQIIFMADTHISLCDQRDLELLEKAAVRYAVFLSPDGDAADASFLELMDYVSKEPPNLLILGGDIVDSAMWASVDFVGEALEKLRIPWVYEMGNHDFEYGGEYFSDTAYSEYLPRLKAVSNTDKGYQLLRYDDFVVFAVDDKNNQVSEEAVDALEDLCREGKPIILVTHVPIEPPANSTLVEETKQVWGAGKDGRSRVLLGPNSCPPNETTQRFLDLILSEKSPVALVLSGHIHFYHKDYLVGQRLQIVTGAGFKKELVKLTLKP